MSIKTNLYIFTWPSLLGGADTRVVDLIKLLKRNLNCNVICIPNDDFRLNEKYWVDFLDKFNVKYSTWDQLPPKCQGIALAFCNFNLFSEKWRIERIKIRKCYWKFLGFFSETTKNIMEILCRLAQQEPTSVPPDEPSRAGKFRQIIK